MHAAGTTAVRITDGRDEAQVADRIERLEPCLGTKDPGDTA